MAKLTLETAVVRYARGDRSPEVMHVLNHESGGIFTLPDPPPEPPDPAVPRPLTFDRLRGWAESRNYKAYEQEISHTLLVRFHYSPSRDRTLELFLALTGKTDTILKLTILGNKTVPPEHLLKALRFVNDWNQDYRWPRAFVLQSYRTEWDEGDEPDEGARLIQEDTCSAALALDQQFDLRHGIHDATLHAFINNALAGSWDFWDQARKAGL